MHELAAIRDEIRNDASNAWATERGYEPIYSASSRSKIVVIGQAPGRQAQDSQIPWNDASGIKLRQWLGVTDAQFYDPDTIALLPMASRGHQRILETMPGVRLTVLIGRYAQKHYLGTSAKRNLTETVRAYRDYLPDRIPLVHPSPLNFRWQAKNPWFETEVIPALQTLVVDAVFNAPQDAADDRPPGSYS
jgi:uracil-DNA glycosylase